MGNWDELNPRVTQVNLSNPKILFNFAKRSPSPPIYLGRSPHPIDPRLGGVLPMSPNDTGIPYGPNEDLHYFLHVANDEYTGMGEAVCAFYLGQLLQQLSRPTRLTQARFLTWDMARKENIIVLGQTYTNAWAGNNLSNPNFDYQAGAFHNKKPEQGEQPIYRCELEGRPAEMGFVDYGLIFMQGLPNGNRVLLLAGASSYGTFGVGEFFCNPEKMRVVYNALKKRSPGGVISPNYEILLKITIKENLPIDTNFVACRVGKLGG